MSFIEYPRRRRHQGNIGDNFIKVWDENERNFNANERCSSVVAFIFDCSSFRLFAAYFKHDFCWSLKHFFEIETNLMRKSNRQQVVVQSMKIASLSIARHFGSNSQCNFKFSKLKLVDCQSSHFSLSFLFFCGGRGRSFSHCCNELLVFSAIEQNKIN